jgi:hypothetical protein
MVSIKSKVVLSKHHRGHCNQAVVVDFHIRQHVETLPSFIKDTTDYLQKMAALNPLPSHTTLITMDVTSLYTKDN